MGWTVRLHHSSYDARWRGGERREGPGVGRRRVRGPGWIGRRGGRRQLSGAVPLAESLAWTRCPPPPRLPGSCERTKRCCTETYESSRVKSSQVLFPLQPCDHGMAWHGRPSCTDGRRQTCAIFPARRLYLPTCSKGRRCHRIITSSSIQHLGISVLPSSSSSSSSGGNVPCHVVVWCGDMRCHALPLS